MPTLNLANVEVMSLKEAMEKYGIARRYGEHLRRPDVNFVEALEFNQVAVFNPCPGPHHVGRKTGQWACGFLNALRGRSRLRKTMRLTGVHKEGLFLAIKLPPKKEE